MPNKKERQGRNLEASLIQAEAKRNEGFEREAGLFTKSIIQVRDVLLDHDKTIDQRMRDTLNPQADEREALQNMKRRLTGRVHNLGAVRKSEKTRMEEGQGWQAMSEAFREQLYRFGVSNRNSEDIAYIGEALNRHTPEERSSHMAVDGRKRSKGVQFEMWKHFLERNLIDMAKEYIIDAVEGRVEQEKIAEVLRQPLVRCKVVLDRMRENITLWSSFSDLEEGEERQRTQYNQMTGMLSVLKSYAEKAAGTKFEL